MQTGIDDGPPNGFLDQCPECQRHFAHTKSGMIRRHQHQGERCSGSQTESERRQRARETTGLPEEQVKAENQRWREHLTKSEGDS